LRIFYKSWRLNKAAKNIKCRHFFQTVGHICVTYTILELVKGFIVAENQSRIPFPHRLFLNVTKLIGIFTGLKICHSHQNPFHKKLFDWPNFGLDGVQCFVWNNFKGIEIISLDFKFLIRFSYFITSDFGLKFQLLDFNKFIDFFLSKQTIEGYEMHSLKRLRGSYLWNAF
jgi:hypothetical protein